MTLPVMAHCRTVARESRGNYCAFIKTNVRVSVRGCALSRFPIEASAKDFPASAMRVDQKRTNELSTEFSTLSKADRRQLEARGRRASAPPPCVHAFGIGNKHQTHVQPARHSLRVYVVSANDTYTQTSISVCVCVCVAGMLYQNMIDNARAQFP